jgi:hypothetical protein
MPFQSRLFATLSAALVVGACGELPPAPAPPPPPPAEPGYSIVVSAPSIGSAQGSSGSGTMVNILRTNFTAAVTLSVEHLPHGVVAHLSPDNPVSGSATQLWLSVAGSAVPGTYSNLVVRGVALGLADRIAPLTLTIREAPFTFTLSSRAISLSEGPSTATTTVNIVRSNFAGPVTLYVEENGHGSLPAGVTAAFAPNVTAGNSSVLTFTVGLAAVPGVYALYVYGQASTGSFDGGLLGLTIEPALGAGLIQQWATTATASSQWSDESGAARQATGAPDVGVNTCGEDDVHHAWSSLAPGNGEWLELTYTTPVQPTMIRIHENWSPGSIVKVEVKDAAGQYTVVYTAPVTSPGCPHTLEIPVSGVAARISAVRISVDQLAHQDWNEIDAVQLVGHP